MFIQEKILQTNWRRKIGQNPQAIYQFLEYYHTTNVPVSDWVIDSLLGLQPEPQERTINEKQLFTRFGIEQFTYEGTPYSFARTFLQALRPTARDQVYDLGCGYGRVVLYGAMTTPANFTGVEVVPERLEQAQAIKERFSVKKARFIAGNVLHQSYSDGTIFFLFNPFLELTLSRVVATLQQIALDHQIKIVVWGGGQSNAFLSQTWLQEESLDKRDLSASATTLRLFHSVS